MNSLPRDSMYSRTHRSKIPKWRPERFDDAFSKEGDGNKYLATYTNNVHTRGELRWLAEDQLSPDRGLNKPTKLAKKLATDLDSTSPRAGKTWSEFDCMETREGILEIMYDLDNNQPNPIASTEFRQTTWLDQKPIPTERGYYSDSDSDSEAEGPSRRRNMREEVYGTNTPDDGNPPNRRGNRTGYDPDRPLWPVGPHDNNGGGNHGGGSNNNNGGSNHGSGSNNNNLNFNISWLLNMAYSYMDYYIDPCIFNFVFDVHSLFYEYQIIFFISLILAIKRDKLLCYILWIDFNCPNVKIK